MARSSLLRRVDRLEQTAVGKYIVYEAGELIPEEERERFVREEIGETAPNSTVVCLLRFGVPDTPPRLLDRRPIPGPVRVQPREAAGRARSREDEIVTPKHNPALSYRDIDTDADDS
jgi:hypothetical protein